MPTYLGTLTQSTPLSPPLPTPSQPWSTPPSLSVVRYKKKYKINLLVESTYLQGMSSDILEKVENQMFQNWLQDKLGEDIFIKTFGL